MDAMQFPLTASFAQAFAKEWIDAWNSHDLERILTHYDDAVILTSPVALNIQSGDGNVRGKEALRAYFQRGLQAYSNLRFDFIEVLWGIETIVISYVNNVRGTKSAEVMLFNTTGRVSRVWANYDR